MTDSHLRVPLIEEELLAIEKLEAAATPGPWVWHGSLKSKVLEIRSEAPWNPCVLDVARSGLYGVHIRVNRGDLGDARAMIPVLERAAHTEDGVGVQVDHPDAVFLTKSREMVPRLIAEVRRCWDSIKGQQQEISRLRKLLDRGRVSGQMTRVLPPKKKK